jgi:hypothetical protein
MAKTKDDPVVEDVDDISSDDSDDDVPDLEEADGSGRAKQSKMEKKSRLVSVYMRGCTHRVHARQGRVVGAVSSCTHLLSVPGTRTVHLANDRISPKG